MAAVRRPRSAWRIVACDVFTRMPGVAGVGHRPHQFQEDRDEGAAGDTERKAGEKPFKSTRCWQVLGLTAERWQNRACAGVRGRPLRRIGGGRRRRRG